MSILQQFSYNGNIVTRRDDNGFVDLNQLVAASGSGKRLDNWFRLKETQKYIKALAQKYGSDSGDLELSIDLDGCTPNKLPHILHPVQGKESDLQPLDLGVVSSQYKLIPHIDSVLFTLEGVNGGTWGHPTLVINLVRWLSVDFAIWCDEHILRLVTTGKTAITIEDHQAIADTAYQRHLDISLSQSLIKERDTVLHYRSLGIPDADMYFMGEIIPPPRFDEYTQLKLDELDFATQHGSLDNYKSIVQQRNHIIQQRLAYLGLLSDSESATLSLY